MQGIPDDRAMKVAVFTPGGPLCLERSLFVNDRTTGKPVKKIPASVDHRIPTADELILYGIEHEKADTTSSTIFRDLSQAPLFTLTFFPLLHVIPPDDKK